MSHLTREHCRFGACRVGLLIVVPTPVGACHGSHAGSGATRAEGRRKAMDVELTVRVSSKRMVADDVAELTLVADGGQPLPGWSAGAHIDIALPGGLVRHYSLCGPLGEQGSYRIAVLRTRDSRGGSRAVHEQLDVGDRVTISAPRNRFNLESAPSYLFLAGGIGITPLVPMAEQCQREDRPWQLHYGGRSPQSMAYADNLRDRYGMEAVVLHPESEVGFIDIAGRLKEAEPSALIYVCGPLPFIEAVRTEARALGRGGRIRAELFSVEEAMDVENNEFEVHLERTGLTLQVPADESILATILAAGVEVDRDCEAGLCGTCVSRVLRGEVEHRDHVLDEGARAANSAMTICVSRAKGDRLVLDI